MALETVNVAITALNETNVHPGGGVDSIEVNITEGPVAPTADFSFALTGTSADPCKVDFTFTGSIGGDDPGNVTYLYEFRGPDIDGVDQSSEIDPVHSYLYDDSYSVKLTVTNSAGSHNVEKTVDVSSTYDNILVVTTSPGGGEYTLNGAIQASRALNQAGESVRVEIEAGTYRETGMFLDTQSGTYTTTDARRLIAPKKDNAVVITGADIKTGTWSNEGGDVYSISYTKIADSPNPSWIGSAPLGPLGLNRDMVWVTKSGTRLRLTPVATEAELADGDNLFWVNAGGGELHVKYTTGNLATDGTITVEVYSGSSTREYIIQIVGEDSDNRIENVVIDGRFGTSTMVFENVPTDWERAAIDGSDGRDIVVQNLVIRGINTTAYSFGSTDGLTVRKIVILDCGSEGYTIGTSQKVNFGQPGETIPSWLQTLSGFSDATGITYSYVSTLNGWRAKLGNQVGFAVGHKCNAVDELVIDNAWICHNETSGPWLDGYNSPEDPPGLPTVAAPILRNSNFSNNLRGVDFEMISGVSAANRATVENCIIHNNKYNGMNLQNIKWIKIDNNDFKDNGTLGALRGSVTYPFAELWISGSTGRDIPGSGEVGEDLIITNNTFEGLFLVVFHHSSSLWNNIITTSTIDDNTYKSPIAKCFNKIGTGGIPFATWQSDTTSSGVTIDDNSAFAKINETYLDTLLRMGPITLWGFQETSGTDAVDATGNTPDAAHGTATNDPTVNATGPTIDSDAYKAYDFDGDDWVDIYSAELEDIFDGDEGTLIGWLDVDSGFWTDSNFRTLFLLRNAAADNEINVHSPNTPNSTLRFVREANNSVQTNSHTVSLTSAFPFVFTWDSDANAIKSYVNAGAAVSGTAPAWTGTDISTSRTLIGRAVKTSGDGMIGQMAFVGLFDYVITEMSRSVVDGTAFT